jgi:AraC-like DNA-binding protein
MYQIDRIWRSPVSERLDGAIADVLLRLLREANQHVDRDRSAAKAILDRASALVEGERSRVEHSASDVPRAAVRNRLAPWQVKRVTAYIAENLGGPIRVPELAQLVRLSGSHFCRAFKDTFGVSPRDYLSARRLNLACVLLLTTDQSLCDVALACGLSDQSHFSRLFSRAFGVPPGAWRRARRGFVARPTSGSQQDPVVASHPKDMA